MQPEEEADDEREFRVAEPHAGTPRDQEEQSEDRRTGERAKQCVDEPAAGDRFDQPEECGGREDDVEDQQVIQIDEHDGDERRRKHRDRDGIERHAVGERGEREQRRGQRFDERIAR
jgi:hypothetical protein